MKIIVNERELKEYMEGLARIVYPAFAGKETFTAVPAEQDQDELRRIIREELKAAFGAIDRGTSGDLQRMQQTLDRHSGKVTELMTPAGTVEGAIESVGGDHVRLRETGGTSVLVPLSQVVSFQLSGKQVER
ncbi:hypothetical protein FHS18_001860 [Paenibacillus phyllosphaerae]|uniref:DUF2642 domain-containing protein n=1 Tax=Paenibacillus phyllosphaerae TaxID=274593 RepID=A0A7W5FM80_9BACL|nr:DUF2642 domain-containing protein [Paenibacillus phyllosphaerae]MBB3109797.1 hypothetical protein [Paenibacillus phyllosphaerae]